jgi:hypothetical protein
VASRCKLTPAAAALFLGEGQLRDDGRVLLGGHAAYILVESVEKPTDNRSTSLLCWRVADVDSPGTFGPGVAPGAFPHTPPCAWGRGYFDGSTRSPC